MCGITLGGGKIKKKIAMRSVLYVPVTITLRCKQMSCHIPAICVAMIAMTTNRVVDNRLSIWIDLNLDKRQKISVGYLRRLRC